MNEHDLVKEIERADEAHRALVDITRSLGTRFAETLRNGWDFREFRRLLEDLPHLTRGADLKRTQLKHARPGEGGGVPRAHGRGVASAVGEGIGVGIRGRIERLEQATEGERTALACPECGEEFTLYGDPALEFIAYEWLQMTGEKNYGPPTDPAAVEMAQHEHDANGFIDKATGEWWLMDRLGAKRWEVANGA